MLDAAGRRLHRRQVAARAVARGALDGTRDRDRRDHVRPVAHRALTDATPGSRSPTLSTQPDLPLGQHAAGRAPVERQRGTQRDDRAQPVGRLQRRDADPLRRRRGRRAARSPRCRRAAQASAGRGDLGQRAAVGGRPPEPDQAERRGRTGRRRRAARGRGPRARRPAGGRSPGRGRWPRPGRRGPAGRPRRRVRTATALSSTPTPLTLGST